MPRSLRQTLPLLLCLLASFAQAQSPAVGIFEGHSDIGPVLKPGTTQYDENRQAFTVSAGGDNVWGTADEFHYAWKKVSGDISLTADIRFPAKTGNPHKKAMLMIRQSLDADSAYVDAALHVEGLTSLQSRSAKGAATHEVGINSASPVKLRLEKRGDYFYMYLAREGEELHLGGGSMRLKLQEPFYIGIGLSAHDKNAFETVEFSNVKLAAPAAGEPKVHSTLETISVSSTDQRVVSVEATRFEAPNWTPDGASLIYNSGGHILKIPVAGGKAEIVDTGFATRANNDHGLSPDGRSLAISDSTQEKKSVVYILPLAGGTPNRITTNFPSYWHGWSPDGKTIAFCGERGGKFDIYTIPVTGGDETRLTQGEGHNDGPEYSPDGQYIYFNSSRTGKMQVWRMKADGSNQEQVTNDEVNNWFPHISPDGKLMAFVSYELGVEGHPANKDVTIRMMNLETKAIKVLASLFGGQGTMNVPSWSPDSKRLAFVSYQLIP